MSTGKNSYTKDSAYKHACQPLETEAFLSLVQEEIAGFAFSVRNLFLLCFSRTMTSIRTNHY